MAWRIEQTGDLDAVKAAVQEARTNDGQPSEQLNRVKQCLAAEIEKLRGRYPRVKVAAAGNEDPTQSDFSASVHALNAE